jgi:hypothetical protein
MTEFFFFRIMNTIPGTIVTARERERKEGSPHASLIYPISKSTYDANDFPLRFSGSRESPVHFVRGERDCWPWAVTCRKGREIITGARNPAHRKKMVVSTVRL